MITRFSIPAILVIVFMAGAGRADVPTTRPAPTTQKLSDKLAVTEHQMTLDGQVLRYKATAGYMTSKDETGKEKANFFFVAYEKQGGEEPSLRPITFVFNGGPGAAAVWLHLGSLGPKRIDPAEQGQAPAPPYKLVDNEATWLDLTDLVFIDPVGTGYSRPAPGEKGEAFYGVKEDVASVAEFIRLYLTRYERWLSPKFLAGESYGTTRAAALSEFLVDRFGIGLNGIAFISTVLDFQTLRPARGNDMAFALFLPSYTAAAWYHKRLAPELQADLGKTLKEVEHFALNDYLNALARGANLDEPQRKAIAEKLARYTGLPLAFVQKSDLRISPDEFRKNLLEDQRQLVGRFDTRLIGYDLRPTASNPAYDPSLSGFLAAYSAGINDYLRTTLRFESDLPYEVLTNRVHPWNFGPSGNGYLNVTDDLRSAMAKLPYLKVLFASGYFDLATPYLATDYTVSHLALDRTLAGNITQTYYLGGHMMYHSPEPRKKLKEDVKAFMRSALAPAGR